MTTHMDYVNDLLIRAMDMLLRKYQKIQNMTTKLVLNRLKMDSVTSAHYELHWLPIRMRIEYKKLLLVFKCLNNMAPNT